MIPSLVNLSSSPPSGWPIYSAPYGIGAAFGGAGPQHPPCGFSSGSGVGTATGASAFPPSAN